ncbi:MAG: putative rane-associated protein [Parcubacteria group bacterium]|nr:putative rane-associated protein [Parcubacteria group bacterium]
MNGSLKMIYPSDHLFLFCYTYTMVFSIEHLQALLLSYKYILLLPIAIFEGPLVTMIAGFLVAGGYMDFWLTYLIVLVGDEIGDILHYALGYFGGVKFIKRFGKYIGVSDEEIFATNRLFKRRGKLTILLSKVLHGIGGVIQIVAGAVKMPFEEFFYYTLAGTLVKTFIILSVGFYFGKQITQINSYFDIFGLASLGIVLVTITLWGASRLYKYSSSR